MNYNLSKVIKELCGETEHKGKKETWSRYYINCYRSWLARYWIERGHLIPDYQTPQPGSDSEARRWAYEQLRRIMEIDVMPNVEIAILLTSDEEKDRLARGIGKDLHTKER